MLQLCEEKLLSVIEIVEQQGVVPCLLQVISAKTHAGPYRGCYVGNPITGNPGAGKSIPRIRETTPII
jgi:hypothetical protein